MYDAKQINCFECGNYDHLLPKEDDLSSMSVKRSHGKILLREDVISCALKEVATL